MHELSKRVRIPYATFYRTIQSMDNLVITEIVGRSKLVTLSSKNPVISSYLAISSEEEKEEYLRESPLIMKITEEISTDGVVLLFGSYADRTQVEESDIDLMIIDAHRKTVSFAKYELIFRKKVNPIFITKKEFTTMLQQEGENVGKQALCNHIILRNPHAFWECVFSVIRQRRIRKGIQRVFEG